VLSNYALSRMLAKEPDAALKLAARAETAAGKSDPKIMRNIAMIRSMAPQAPAPAAIAVAAPPQAPAAHTQTATAPQAAKPAPQASASATHDNRVVMQRVPVDPQAGPVQAPKPAPVNTATQAPRSLQPQVAAAAPAEPHVEAPKPVMSQPLPAPIAPVKAAENKPAPVAAAPVKAAPVAVAKVAPPKPVETASASVTLRLAPPLKGESDKPAQPPKVLPPTPVKAVANKDAVPGLRISASAY